MWPVLPEVGPRNLTEWATAHFPIVRRAFREGIHFYTRVNDLHILFKKNAVLTYNNDGELISEFRNFRGSRPLNVCSGPQGIFFGEYFSNPDRDHVCIYTTKDGVAWTECFKFDVGQIRHIHGIQYDQFEDGYWIMTGDSNAESGLWYTGDHFQSVELVESGSQKSRAVSIHVLPDRLIVPSDTPLEPNYIRSFSRNSKTFKNLSELPGSAFHCTKIKDIYFVSTVTEASDINITKDASVYASFDCCEWRCIIKLEKDIFPVALQKYTRYSEIRLLDNLWNDRFIVGAGRALNCVSDGSLCWEYDEIKEELELALGTQDP